MKTYRCILFRSAIPGYVQVKHEAPPCKVGGAMIVSTIIIQGKGSPEASLEEMEMWLSYSPLAFKRSILGDEGAKVNLFYQPLTGIVFLDGAPCGVIQVEGDLL